MFAGISKNQSNLFCQAARKETVTRFSTASLQQFYLSVNGVYHHDVALPKFTMQEELPHLGTRPQGRRTYNSLLNRIDEKTKNTRE